MSARVLGIDIGSHGAIALLTPTGGLIEVRDMPVLLDGPRGRPNVSAALLADIVFKMKALTANVESVSARPGEGAVGAFAFGRSPRRHRRRLWRCWRSAELPDARPSEATGRDSSGEGRREGRCPIGGDPTLAGARRAVRTGQGKDDGRAEAALIAVAGLVRAGLVGLMEAHL
jgi:crossover junction endodeoxyribonuclease RuvC